MKSLLLAGVAAAFAAGTYFPPAMAQPTPFSRGYPSQAVQQSGNGTADTGMNAPHYEYRYHYGGSPRHPRWESGPVLVR